MSENQRTTGTEWKWIRNEVIIRDEYECQECGALGGLKGDETLHVHHIKPVSEGGSDDRENLTTLCESCHYDTHSSGDVDGVILDELSEGRNIPANIADEAGVTRQYIHQRLKLFEAAGNVRNVGSGLYELVEDPRDD